MATLDKRLVALEQRFASRAKKVCTLADLTETWAASEAVGGVQPLLARLESGQATDDDRDVITTLSMSRSAFTPLERLKRIAEMERGMYGQT